MPTMPKVYPCLWFDGNAEEAVEFYVKLVPDSSIDKVWRSPAETPSGPAGMVLTIDFTVGGQPLQALNGGPEFKFNEAISLEVECADQDEIDYYWEKLSEGGEEGPCGWLKDKFGLSWQIVPEALPRLMSDKDRAKADRVMQAMLKMKKIVVADLEQAAAS